jgi:hypothetical protein
MSNATDLDRATKARAILDAPIYQESYDLVRTEIIRRIESCPLSDTPTAESLRTCLRLLRDVRLNMELALKSGQVAEFRIAEDEKRKKNPLRGIFYR